MCWVFEHLKFQRHQHHVLVPKFIGRCILNAINHHALPVEVPTPATRAVVMVDQYGLLHDRIAVATECMKRGYVLIEDSPYGMGHDENVGKYSFARFISLAKILPIVQGGLVISEDQEFVEFVKRRRCEHSAWSWVAWAVVAVFRCRQFIAKDTTLVSAAYEIYPHTKGGNVGLRNNMRRILERFERFEFFHAQCVSFAQAYLADRVILPELRRLIYAIPLFSCGDDARIGELFRREGFDDTMHHIDISRNLFSPEYRKAFLLPVSGCASYETFHQLAHSIMQLQ